MICVLCPFAIDKGLVSKAVTLAGNTPVRVLVPEKDTNEAVSLGAMLIHTITVLPSDEASFALWLKEKILQWKSTVILAPASVQMRNIMPMLAWHLHAGLTADCTDLSLEDGHLLQTRPAFGNSLMATIRTHSPIQMATVRTGTFPEVTFSADSYTVTKEVTDFEYASVTQTDFRSFTDGTPLPQAQVIIAGGIGIGSREGFAKLEQLCKKHHAALAASRKAVDAGFAPFRCQVGMTGVTVCPKIYIAVGISGAVQHLSGMSGSETVIAINSDPKAPIFDYADYGIVADWESVIDKLLEELS